MSQDFSYVPGRPLYYPPAVPDSTSFGPCVTMTPQQTEQQGLYEMEIKKEDSYCAGTPVTQDSYKKDDQSYKLAPRESYKLAVSLGGEETEFSSIFRSF